MKTAKMLFVVLFVLAGALFFASGSRASVTAYVPDSHTLHLYHLDDAGHAADTGYYVSNRTALTVSANTTGCGQAAYNSALGKSVLASTTTFSYAAQPQSNFQGADGAFTVEALISYDPTTAGSHQIFYRDPGSGSRAFQFYVSSGVVTFIETSPSIVFFNATIPTSGPNAYVSGDWYHVAVTYDGNANTTGNVKLYWTHVTDTVTTANRIDDGTLKMTSDLTAANVPTSYIGPGGNGKIDEVRISDIARAPSDFLFHTDPEVADPPTSTLTWTAASGNWTDSSWTGTTPPNYPNDTDKVKAIINASGQTITVDSPESAYSVSVTDGTLGIADGGSLSLTYGATIASGAGLSIAGTGTLSAASLNTAGTNTISDGATISVGSAILGSAVSIGNGTHLTSTSSIDVNAAFTAGSGSTVTTADLNVNSGGTLNVDGGNLSAVTQLVLHTGGTLTQNAALSVGELILAGGTHTTNGNDLTVSTGLTLSGANLTMTGSGTLNAAGATVAIETGRTLTIVRALPAATLTMNGTGALTRPAGANGNVTVTSALNLNGASLNMTGNTLTTTGADVLVNGACTLTLGNAISVNTLTVAAGGTVSGAYSITSPNDYATTGTYAYELRYNGTHTVNANLGDEGGSHAALRVYASGAYGAATCAVLSGTNTYTGKTRVESDYASSVAQLRLLSAGALPANSVLELSRAVIQTNDTILGGSFTRSVGTAPGMIAFDGAAGGGFAAYNALPLTVNLGGSSTELTWGSGSFVSGTLWLNCVTSGGAAATGTVDFQNPINLNTATAAVRVDTDVARLSGALRNGNLSKGGNGWLELTGDNSTWTGTVAITLGTLRVASSGALGTAAGGTTISNNGSLELSGNITLADNFTVTGNGYPDTGRYGVLHSTSGANILNGTVAMTGSSQIAVDAGSMTFNGTFSGVAPTKIGNGTLVLAGNNSFTGAMTVTAGVLRIAHGNALGTTANGTSIASGTALEIQGGISTPAGEAISVAGTGISSTGVIRNLSGNNTIGGAITATSASTIGVDANSTLTLTGNITGGGAITKVGGGVLEIGNANTFAGPLTVSNGTLEVTGSTAGGTVAVNSGTTLIATGTVGGTATIASTATLTGSGHVTNAEVQAGGIVAPGSSPGTLSVDGLLTLDAGAIYDWQIASLLLYDSIDVLSTGVTPILGTGVVLRLNDVGVAPDALILPSDTFDIITYAGLLSYTTPWETVWTIDHSLLDGNSLWDASGATILNDTGHKKIVLTGLRYGASSVPEPAALGMIGIILLAIRKRRKF